MQDAELASGSIPAAGARFQRAAGIDGTAEQTAEDILRKNGGRADREIVRDRGEVRAALVAQGVDRVAMTHEQFAEFAREEYAKWDGVIRSAGIKPD